MSTVKAPLDYRAWALRSIERLMTPGLGVQRWERDALLKWRDWLGFDEKRGPGEAIRIRLWRMLRRHSLEPRRPRMSAAARAAAAVAEPGAEPRIADWQHRPGAPMPRPPRRSASTI